MSYLDDDVVGYDNVGDTTNSCYSAGGLPDYTYRPSKFRTLGLDDEEYALMDEWAADIYKTDYDDGSPYNVNIDRTTRGIQIRDASVAANGGDNNVIYGRLSDYLGDFSLSDTADLDSHIRCHSGYMLSVLLLVADKVWEKGQYLYLDIWIGAFDPITNVCVNEPNYDSEDEVIPNHPQVLRYRVTLVHAATFFHFYTSGCRYGISVMVRDALYQGVSMGFDFYPWLTSTRDGWKKEARFESGQLKIFLASLRAFDKLPPGVITVLVIGSSSHPVRSGYTYHALARFLTLSGFSGKFHLFDPLENHLTCQIGNFTLIYFAQEYRLGSQYKIDGQPPTVILDDVYLPDGKYLVDLDPTYSLVLNHPKARVCMKHHSEVKIPKELGVQVHLAHQYAHNGHEMRAYYRVPTANVMRDSQWVGNMQCAQCWHYAGLISRVGKPLEDLKPYWRIMYSLSGHHCTTVPGIRNVMLLTALRHQIARGNTKDECVTNVYANLPSNFGTTEVGVKRVFEFAQKVDPEFILTEQHYAPNYDMEFSVRDHVTPREVVDHLLMTNVTFRLYRGVNYAKSKFERVLELYNSVEKNDTCVVDVVLVTKNDNLFLDQLIFVEQMTNVDLSGFDVLYSAADAGVLIRKGLDMGVRMLFDRGRVNYTESVADWYD